MKSVGVIPARYHSRRIPGKALEDIGGKPMLWWVYQHVRELEELSGLYVATDDIRIKEVCEKFGIPALMTSPEHSTHIDRLREASLMVDADFYLCVCGDEPLLKADSIRKVFPEKLPKDKPSVSILARPLLLSQEIKDPSNIKLCLTAHNRCIALSRAVIPHAYSGETPSYYKLVGAEGYNRAALELFSQNVPGPWELAEDVTLLRFIEQQIPVDCTITTAYQISVDTYPDLEKVREIMEEKVR